MGWLSGWLHRKPVTITGQGGAGTDYQVILSIGDSAGGDFHLEGNCTNFPQDIAVTDNDGTTLLDHWVEDLTSDPIKLWVEVADSLESDVDVYIYYDKTGESSASNINTTFLFGDDFPGSSIDTNKWTGDTGSTAVSSGVMTLTGDAAAWKAIYSTTEKTIPFAFRTKAQIVGRADPDKGGAIGVRDVVTVDLCDMIYYDNTHNHLRSYKAGSDTSIATNIDTLMNIYEIAAISTSVKYSKNGIEMTNSPIVTNIPIVDMPIYFTCIGGAGYEIKSNWALIRKYQADEPAFSSAGSEENALAAYTYGSRGVYPILF